MKDKEKIILIFFIISLFVVFSLFLVSNDSGLDSSDDELLPIANTSLTAVKMLSKGGSVTYGPEELTDKHKETYPALLEGIETSGNYMIIISYQNEGVYLVMNRTDLIKEQRVNNMAFN